MNASRSLNRNACAPGNTRSSAPGIRAAIRWRLTGGTTGSSRPAAASVGAPIARQLAVVAVAAQPGVLGGDLCVGGPGRHVEVVGDLAALARGHQPAQEAPALGLVVRRVELVQDFGVARVGVAVDPLRGAGAEHGLAAAGVGAGEDQVAHPLGMVDGEALGDEAAHRPPEHVRALDADRVHERRGRVGQRVERARSAPGPREPDPRDSRRGSDAGSRASSRSSAGSHSDIVEPVPISITSAGPRPRSYQAIGVPPTSACCTLARKLSGRDGDAPHPATATAASTPIRALAFTGSP